MNPRAFDLVVRSITTSLLALLLLLIVGYESVRKGDIDPALLAIATTVFGFFFGAHVSQNGAAARSRAESLAVSQAMGEAPPADPLATIGARTGPGG